MLFSSFDSFDEWRIGWRLFLFNHTDTRSNDVCTIDWYISCRKECCVYNGGSTGLDSLTSGNDPPDESHNKVKAFPFLGQAHAASPTSPGTPPTNLERDRVVLSREYRRALQLFGQALRCKTPAGEKEATTRERFPAEGRAVAPAIHAGSSSNCF